MHISGTFTLPIANEDDERCQIFSKLQAPVHIRTQAVGRWFEAFITRRRHQQTISHHSQHSSSEDENANELSEDEEDDSTLFKLDPKEWKDQDHYAVIGLAKLRYRASEDQIKKAYKKKVLKHHPDKRKARGEIVKDGDDDYFTCITRAYEILGNPIKRRAFDSVDPLFDNDVPGISDDAKSNFYEVFTPVFDRNARWSNKKQKVPSLGGQDMTFEQVSSFYSYWYDFESWREFSYLDEEDKEKGENRDERRWIDKQNKAARIKRKKEENARLRSLVDNAYACDPRIAKHKEEEKAKKEALKQAKKDAVRKRTEAEERRRQEAQEEERKLKEKEDEQARQKAEAERKEREAQKKVLKRERKTLRTKLKDYSYFAENDDEKVKNMTDMDRLAELLSSTSLQELNQHLTSGDECRAKTAFHEQVGALNAKIEKERQEQLEALKRQQTSTSGGQNKVIWSDEETQLLIKSFNLFPAGTVQRWETIAAFLTQHIPTSKKTGKEVLAKAKDLQKNDSVMKEAANKKAFDRFSKGVSSAVSGDKKDEEISHRFDSVADVLIGETGSNPAPWSPEEQKLLEQALKTYPSSTPDRWDKIAETLPHRTKKDCMKRYKELVEMVRAKKAAAMAAAKKK